MDHSLASKIGQANTDLIVNGNLDTAERHFTADYAAHLTESNLEGGPAAVRRFVTMLRGAFADLQVEVQILLESGNRVAWQRTVRGTHNADFMGFPATGRKIVWRDMITSEFRDGMIAEEWAVSDLAERLLLARKR